MIVLLLLAVRLPFLPTTLEDIDSVNFDLGVHDFNPLLHQPHPPGYTVYIAAAKLVHPFFPSHAQGLAFVSAIFGAAAIVPLVVLMRMLVGATAGWLAGIFVIFTPIVWFNSVRPMSDTMGLFAVLSAMALLVAARELRQQDAASDRLWNIGAFVAGLSLGIRIQTVMLVGPLLVYGWFRQKRVRQTTLVFFGLGVAAWLIPLVVLSGGPGPLWHAFVDLVRDAVPVEPLLSQPTWHLVRWAVQDSFFAPWGPPRFSGVVVACALVGAGILAWSDRQRLFLLALLFLPYATYHFFLQWTSAIRYALPIVPAVAALAAVPFVRWRRSLGIPVGVVGAAYVAASIAVTGPALCVYGSTPSPPAQAIARLAEIGRAAPGDIVISGNFMFNRYLPWLPPDLRVIRPTPRVEWRLLANYWKQGGRLPVYFLLDPVRTNLLLIDLDAQHPVERWTWPDSVARLLKGARPTDIQLVRIDPPRWFAESGFFITNQAGPVNRVERQPHRLYVRTDKVERKLRVSGEVTGGGAADIIATVGDREVGRWTVNGQFSIQTTVGPFASEGEYVPTTFAASEPLRLKDVWLESSSGATIRPGSGFYMPERDERATPFRWIGPDATSYVVLPSDALGATLRLRGRLPVENVKLPVRIGFVVGGRTIGTHTVTTENFEIAQEIPANGGEVRVQILTSQHFVPDDTEKNGDHRTLSVRVYELIVDRRLSRGSSKH